MFRRLLIANRGEVAVRIARAARAQGITPIGVASAADLGASWLGAMDEVVTLGPAASKLSYLNAEAVLEAALQTRASALHPGWGFLAEDARFAALCEQHGVTFVGPPPAIMLRMGLKSPAKAAMRAAGLPVVPGSDGPLADAEAAVLCAADTGYPVILKADAGGGGRGMRLCRNADEVRAAFASACMEAESAFGNRSIYLERYLEGGRHVEVQVLADHHGSAVHLYERDCSVQRKHQKLIEEAPCPLLSAEEREALGARAAEATAAIGYVGAGTIEFLRDSDGELYFLEMNTRLQVEHPVTEVLTGVDIVQEQLCIAAHWPLSVAQADIALEGHAIECRINAEDPLADFRPSPGVLEKFALPSGNGIRVETHLSAGDEVSPHYDSLIAKLIAKGADRGEATRRMLDALAAAEVSGVATTIPLHRSVLASEAFRDGDYDTTRIPGWPPASVPTGS